MRFTGSAERIAVEPVVPDLSRAYGWFRNPWIASLFSATSLKAAV